MRVPVRQLHKRQSVATHPIPVDIPGVSGGTTATNAINSAESTLLINTNTASIPSASVPAIVSGSVIVVITTPLLTASSSNTVTSSPSSAASSGANPISLGTVIATCLGAFAGLLILVLVALWWYKRSGQNIKRSDGRLHPSRNARRKRDRPDPWNRLEEKEVDVWEGMVPSPSTKGVIFPSTTEFTLPAKSTPQGSTDKLGTMFKKSPSLHSTEKDSSESNGAAYFAQTLAQSAEFAKYHPHLAEELAKTVTPMRANMTRQSANGPISWDGETIREDDTFVSLRSQHFNPHLVNTTEALSPPLVKVINTPAATTSQPHYWESAEVMHYDEADLADIQHVQNPFADIQLETRTNTNNPFFNAQGQVEVPRRRSPNPFSDSARVSRNITGSTPEPLDSAYDADRALQSLIAALNVPPKAERIASMQSTHASVISTASDYASIVDFPIPPTHAPRRP